MTQAIDDKKKKGPIKASDRMLAWLKDAQYATWKKTGEQPTYAELLDGLLDAAEALSKVSPANGLEIGSPVPAKDFETKQQRELGSHAQLPVEAKEWLDLAQQALRVEDPDWREMLQNIKRQLAQVAHIANTEQRNRRDSPEPGITGGAASAQQHGEDVDRSTGRHRKKA